MNEFNLEDLIASILNQYYEESEIDNPVPLNITIVEDMTSAYEEVTGNQIVNDWMYNWYKFLSQHLRLEDAAPDFEEMRKILSVNFIGI